ncbi:MAG: hypothetical protein GY801_30940 [bacterium]|nr:hypothetical protein [bacterium]
MKILILILLKIFNFLRRQCESHDLFKDAIDDSGSRAPGTSTKFRDQFLGCWKRIGAWKQQRISQYPLELRVPQAMKTAYLLPQKQAISFESIDNFMKLPIPKFRCHCAVVLEYWVS